MKNFDLERIKQLGSKVKVYKNKIKATMTALVLGASTGCGYVSTVPSYNNEGNTTSIESSMEETNTKVETTIESTIAEFIQATTGSKQPATYKKPQSTTESEKVTTKVEKNETSKITSVTTANNNKNNTTVTSTTKINATGNNNSVTTTNKKTQSTTNSTQPNTQAPTEEQTQSNTQKPTQNTTQSTTKKPVQTTTQVTTKAPVVTTTTTTPAPTQRQYVLEDIKTDPEAYKYFAEKLWKELYNGHNILRTYGNSSGYNECMVMLGLLNYNQGISPEVLGEVLGSYSETDVVNYSGMDIAYINYACADTSVDFNKYMFDKNFANEINTVNAYFIEASQGNGDNFTNALYSQITNSPGIDQVDNYPEFWYYYSAGDEAWVHFGLNTRCISEPESEMYDNRIIHDFYSTFKGYSYTR